MIVSAFSNSKLSFEVLERKETMGCIEFFIVLAMASLYFSIVPWCVGLDQLVTNIKLLQGFFKKRWLGIFSTNQPIREFAAVISLHAFDSVGKTLHTMLNKQCGRIGAVFREGLQIAKPGVFINEGVLVPLCRFFLPYNTDIGNKFHIDLYPLAGIRHLFIGLWRVFLWIGQFYSH